jgi:hypothetical protein
VSEGEAAHLGCVMEGGEGFYIAQSGRCPDLLVIWGGRREVPKRAKIYRFKDSAIPKVQF